MIVVEGADNSGKTTFAKSLDLPYFSAGPAPTTVIELSQCLKDQWERSGLPCVQDRLTCISQRVYSDAPESVLLNSILEDLVKVRGVVIVYCRPPERVLMDFSTHQVKSYDTAEHIERIMDKQHEYVKRYDDIMATVPHVLYDWTDLSHSQRQEFQRMVTLTQRDMAEWKMFMNQVNRARARV